MYLILYIPRENGIAQTEKSTYKIVGAWDEKGAISTFFGLMDERVSIVKRELFDKLISHLEFCDVIELYNSISTSAYITDVFGSLAEIYTKKEDEIDA